MAYSKSRLAWRQFTALCRKNWWVEVQCCAGGQMLSGSMTGSCWAGIGWWVTRGIGERVSLTPRPTHQYNLARCLLVPIAFAFFMAKASVFFAPHNEVRRPVRLEASH